MVILTSCLNLYEKDENGNRVPHHIGNENGVFDIIKNNVEKCDNFLFVASDETNFEMTDMYASVTFKSFDMSLPFKKYSILDGRTKSDAKKLVEEADFIYVCGGHVPTQNKFFQNINLREIIKNANALILGVSAGSMNSADVVYCAPELEGESIDPNFQRYLKGLGFTNTNIMPHYNDCKDEVLDGKEYMKEIVAPDSFKKEIILINDGTFIVCSDNKETVYGEAYILKDGVITQICENDKCVDLVIDDVM